MKKQLDERLERIANLVKEHLDGGGEDCWTTAAVLAVVRNEQVAMLELITNSLEQTSKEDMYQGMSASEFTAWRMGRMQVMEFLIQIKECLLIDNS